ncbi:MAG: Amuc_1098 family type IV pilus outer membrane protein [bacterium]
MTLPLPTNLLKMRSSCVVAALTAFLFFVLSSQTVRAEADLVAISEREILKRQEEARMADELIKKARNDLADKNLEAAYSNYLQALQATRFGAAADKQRTSLVAEFSKTGIDYANWLISNGRYQDAENVAKTILSSGINPSFKPAAQLLANLEQPGYYNRTVTPAFASKRDEVKMLLNQAEGYYATGRNDLATKRYEQVLNLDPYSIAARNGLEKVNKQRKTYYDSAYNEARSRMLWLSDRAWERPVKKLAPTGRDTANSAFGNNPASTSKDAINNKLNKIIIDKIHLDQASIREVVDFLKQKSRQMDTSTDDPKKKGVNIVLKLASPNPAATPAEGQTSTPSTPSVSEDTKISISLKNVPLIEAVRYMTELAGLKYKIEPFAVSIIPITENTEELVTKEYRVPPGFIPASAGESVPTGPLPGGQATGDANTRITGRRNATQYFTDQGVPFPTGAFAQYIASGSKLIVRNTQAAVDLIDTIVEGATGVAPTQVEIESKFVEISQNNLNELGFDWLLGPFAIGGGVYGDGGTRNGGQALSSEYYANYPFGTVGTNPVTGGNRNGIGTSYNSAITANSLNALLGGIPQGTNVASPGVFGIAGVFTNPQFQMVIRAISQQKGVDLMSAPKVTTKSGIKATIKVVREFPYPTAFTPPQVPPPSTNQQGNAQGAGGIVVTSGAVTPSTPSEFEKRDIGVRLEVEPQVGADNYTIDLSLSPEVVEFDGFVNYGSPIVGPRYDPALILAGNRSGIGTFVLTPNVMNQPIFSVRKVTTSVSIWDGQTVALGGLIREDVQKVNDKVPILGDIPLAGRLFRSNVDQKIKKNLIVFVTARLMNAEGQPLLQQDDEEESVQPLGLPEDLPPPVITSRSAGK